MWDTIRDAVRPGTNTARLVNFVFIPILAILVLLMPPFSVLARIGGGGDSSGGQVALSASGGKVSLNGLALEVQSGVLDSDVNVKIRRDAKEPKDQVLPQDVSAASSFYSISFSKPSNVPVSVEVDLSAPAGAGDNLDLFALDGNSWQWVAGTTLSDDGRTAKASLRQVPSALVVGRIAPQKAAVSGWVPANGGIDSVAQSTLAVANPLGYAVKEDGSVTGSPSSVAKGQFQIVPTLQNVSDGAFKGETVNSILRSDDLRQKHVANIVNLAKQNSYAGVDINYQGIDPILASKYTSFISDLASALHQEKLTLSVEVPLPDKTAKGLDTGAYDWYALGKAADSVTISAERDQSAYASRMTEALAYAATQIDRRKLQLAVSTLSHEKSKTGVKDLSLSDALATASKVEFKGSPKFQPGETVTAVAPNMLKDNGATGIYWNGDTKTVTFSYAAAADDSRTVWIENAFSVAYKLQLAKQFNLRGVSVQNLGDTAADKAFSGVLQAFKTDGSVQLTEPSSQSLAVNWKASDGTSLGSGAAWINYVIPNSVGANFSVSIVVGDGVTSTTGLKTLMVAALPTPTPTSPPLPTATSRPAQQNTPPPPPPATATSAPKPVTAPPPGGMRYAGVGYGFQVDPGTNLPKALQLSRAAGFNWIKIQVRWDSVEGSKGNINWGYLDGIVNQMDANGMYVLFSLTAAPRWSTPADYTTAGPPANPQDLADFVGAIANRYAGRVHAYEIWNEQNLNYEWGGLGRRLNAAKYVDLLKASYNAIKTADPNAVVVSGALSPTGVNDGNIAYDDVVYLDMMYQAGVKNYADAIGVHGNVIYPYGPDQTVATNGGHGSFYFRRFEELRAVMERYGDSGKQMWFTEFGWPSSATPLANYQFANQINESQQAEWLVRAFDLAKEKGYIGPMFVWDLNYGPSAEPDDVWAKLAFCVLRRDWSPRPAYNALAAMPK